MENKNKSIKASFSKILLAVTAISLCAALCWAYDVNGTLNFGTGKDVEKITGEFVKVYGTLNMYSGAYNDWGIYVYPGAETGAPGGTVNVYGCETGNTLWVLEPSSERPGLPPVVTVYGPKFKVGTQEYFPPLDIAISGPLDVLSKDNQVLFSLTIYSDINIHLRADVITVDIDIKPGNEPNPINQGSNGLIPVAILTTDTFNAADVDPGSVTLNGAEVAVRGKSDKLMARLEDIDGDGDEDLMLQVDTESWDELWADGEVTLTGKTYIDLGAKDIQGTDYVIIVPPE